MVRQLFSVLGNSQKLDGGAMFGNAPKAMWSKWVNVDEQNRIDLRCRALLVKDGERHILFESGIGAFFEPRLRERYGVVESEHVLLQSLAALNVTPEMIDVVVLSHLHFDHVGGILKAWQADTPLQLAFPNARYVVGAQAWERAAKPHARDKASFVAGLLPLLDATNKVEKVSGDYSVTLGEGYRFFVSDGHTPGMLLSEIATSDGPVVFCADLIPGTAWVHVPITMGYDRYPELLINEKEQLLTRVVAQGGRLFYTHDADTAISGVQRDEAGRFTAINPQRQLFSSSR